MTEDSELLRRYIEDRSEAAFSELVQRRVNLVYSVALRQVGGDTHLAEDVTQKVFTDLARKAPSLVGRPVLSGWLYRSAQFAGADVVRSERRRRAREEETRIMNETTANPGESSADWEKLRPVLDQAMGELDDDDRDAVALRFFDERSFAEIGRSLSLSEEAARKRVNRAIDQLHGFLARRGVTSTTAALAVAMANQASVAAPAGLAAAVTGAAMASAGGLGAAGILTFMSMTKISTAVVGVIILGALGFGVYEMSRKPSEPSVEQPSQKKRAPEVGTGIGQAVANLVAPEKAVSDRRNAGRVQPEKIDTPLEKKPLMPELLTAEAWSNVGRATAAKALETTFWAADRGEIDALADAVVYSPPAKAKLDAFFAARPEEMRTKYGTAEKLMALLLAEKDYPVALQAVSETALGSDAINLHARVRRPDGEMVELDAPFLRSGDGWRLMVAEFDVDAAIARFGGAPRPPQTPREK